MRRGRRVRKRRRRRSEQVHQDAGNSLYGAQCIEPVCEHEMA